jgi:hypothetical protein
MLGDALLFDGINGYAQVQVLKPRHFPAINVAAWINPSKLRK